MVRLPALAPDPADRLLLPALDQAGEARGLEPRGHFGRRGHGPGQLPSVAYERVGQPRVDAARRGQPLLEGPLELGCVEAQVGQAALGHGEEVLGRPLDLGRDHVRGHEREAQETHQHEEGGEQDEGDDRDEQVRDEQLAADAPQQAAHEVPAEAEEPPGQEQPEDYPVDDGHDAGHGRAGLHQAIEKDGCDHDLPGRGARERAQPSAEAVGGRGPRSGQPKAETRGHRLLRGVVCGRPDYSTRNFCGRFVDSADARGLACATACPSSGGAPRSCFSRPRPPSCPAAPSPGASPPIASSTRRRWRRCPSPCGRSSSPTPPTSSSTPWTPTCGARSARIRSPTTSWTWTPSARQRRVSSPGTKPSTCAATAPRPRRADGCPGAWARSIASWWRPSGTATRRASWSGPPCSATTWATPTSRCTPR